MPLLVVALVNANFHSTFPAALITMFSLNSRALTISKIIFSVQILEFRIHHLFLSLSSYCSEDRPIQKFSPFLSVCNCKLCSRPVNPELDPGGYTFIQAPCCGVIIHRNCLQREASIKSVDTFKCPSCEDPRGKFLPEMQDFGIYIPKV